MDLKRTLPEWQDAWSDGCSIPFPDYLRRHIKFSPKVRACCVAHDRRYYYGGSEADRWVADLLFQIDLIRTGELLAWVIEGMILAVRMFGGPEGRNPKYSWAFGGQVFQYTAQPAEVEG